jgi:hypothetical protein
MTYTNRPGEGYAEPAVVGPAVEYHDRVRWGPIIAGLVTALSLQLVLSSLGAAVGLSTLADAARPSAAAGDVGTGVGIWTVISVLISLFLGGYAMARACGPMSRSSAILNGAILWGTTLAISSWLIASGVSGTFGAVLSSLGGAAAQIAEPGGTGVPNVQAPNVSSEQARQVAGNVARANWWFALGSLLSLIAALIGAAVGTRKPRTPNNA